MPLALAKVVMQQSKGKLLKLVTMPWKVSLQHVNNIFVLDEVDKARQPVMNNSRQAQTLDCIDAFSDTWSLSLTLLPESSYTWGSRVLKSSTCIVQKRQAAPVLETNRLSNHLQRGLGRRQRPCQSGLP